ncbi:MAG: hypothetical protein SWE60_07785 [Thermodesulfobacteriota bacterium]|nr:hypothetical protein [Thermodesulfobacteriota bacterium]
MDAHDLEEYFELYDVYQETEDPRLIEEMDNRLSEYKNRFHKNSEEVLSLMKEGKETLMDKYRAPFQDLLFDLEMHAKSMEEIRKTHTFDTERDMWVPKKR